jgi:cysteinyl-tRNA synthetase
VTLKLYNTAVRRKEEFAPLDRSNVRIYVCGPTVYDYAHIGNARPVIVFDVLFRLLQSEFGAERVTYVRNITDVEDKIIAAAKENGESIAALTARTAKIYQDDMAWLGNLPPTFEPRATEHIAGMVAMIEQLIAGGHAYVAEGHVLFHVSSMADYGKLSGRNRDELIEGARVEVAPYKKDPGDFVLWKPSMPDMPGWDSPWGRGRPGWHIECSAMSKALLGVTFDIHGGGRDLIFPHHENEVAQSLCANHAPFARYWVHNGFVTVYGEKMSKSLGNFLTINDLRAKYPPEAVRLAMLKTHYRQPLDWTDDGVREAKADLDKFYLALRDVGEADIVIPENPSIPGPILAALEDDLNTPQALAHLHELVRDLNVSLRQDPHGAQAELAGGLLAAGAVLGLLQQEPHAWLQGGAASAEVSAIEDLIARRQAAKREKNFAEADRIRDELAGQGIVLEDKPGGKTEWRRAG